MVSDPCLGQHSTMIRAYITASSVGMLLALPALAAPVDTGDLARCHAMPTRDERLDCYEALATSAVPAGPTASSVSPAPAAQTSTGAASPSVPPSAAASGAGPAAVPAGSFDPDEPANFGLNRHQVEPHPGAPSAVKSIVSQMTEDRMHNITVVLDNGQTWAFIEPEPRLRPGDAVTIKRASLGSFLMLTPSRRSYRVERLK
jgi:hypothetical protein